MGFLYQWLWVRILHGVPVGLKLKWYKRPAHNGEIISSNLIGPTKIQENKVLRFLLCLFGLHGATEIDYTVDDEEIKVCRNCLEEVK